MNTIFCPSGDQSASSSIYPEVFVMFIGSSITSPSKSGTLMMKMSLSAVGAPGSFLIGSPVPDAEGWNAMYLPFGDQVAELPRISSFWCVPSVFIKNRSEVLPGSLGSRSRLLSNTINCASKGRRWSPQERRANRVARAPFPRCGRFRSGDSFAKALAPTKPLTPTSFSVSRTPMKMRKAAPEKSS